MTKNQFENSVHLWLILTDSVLSKLTAMLRKKSGLFFLIRLVIMGLLVASYCLFDWLFVREFLAVSVTTLLKTCGVPASCFNFKTGISIMTETGLFSITKNCTYLDLVFILVPLIWRTQLGFSTNVLRIGVMVPAIMAANALRIFLAIILTRYEVSWFLAHDILHYGIHLAAVAILAVRALRNDLQ